MRHSFHERGFLKDIKDLNVIKHKKKPPRFEGACGIGRRPTLPPSSGSTIGAAGLNFSVRNGKRCAPALSSPQYRFTDCCPRMRLTSGAEGFRPSTKSFLCFFYERSSKFRVISTARLCHRWLYTCGLSTSSSVTTLQRSLILRRVSHLDAFSAYLVRT